MKEFDSI